MIELPLMVLTGAGVSAESGVPTFRGKDGLWRKFSPEDLANPYAFARDPELVWEWYAWRREKISRCQPNAAHATLVEIEETLAESGATSGATSGRPDAGAPFTLVTQNVDGLHELAGSRKVLRLHGSIWWMRCPEDGTRLQDRRVPLDPLPPVCPECQGYLRPDIVWFGESLDSDLLNAASRAASESATFLIIGTSALVHPAASLPMIAHRSGARLIEINPEETPISSLAAEILRGPAASELPKWWGSVRP